MKKYLFSTLMVLALAACNQTEPTSLCSVYQGTIPAADGPGIEMTLTLKDNNSFTNKLVYIDSEDGIFDEAGSYSIANNIITAKTADEISYYKIEDNRLRILDYQKQEVTGPMADMYILVKTRSCK